MVRKRTKLTKCDISRLEGVFAVTQWPSRQEKEKLAEELAMNDTVINTWFQNKRARLRRRKADKGNRPKTAEMTNIRKYVFHTYSEDQIISKAKVANKSQRAHVHQQPENASPAPDLVGKSVNTEKGKVHLLHLGPILMLPLLRGLFSK